MEKKGFSIKEAIRFGWDRMRENLAFFIMFIVISWLVNLFFGIFSDLFEERLPVFSVLFSIGGLLASFLISYISVRVALNICDGVALRVSELFQFPLSRFLRFILGNILYMLLVAAGFVLLIVPGLIWMIKYQYVPYLIIDKDSPIGEAFSESGRITSGVKWPLFWFALLLGLINIAGALVFLVGLFATIPTTIIAIAYVYRKLSSGSESPVGREAYESNPFAAPGITP
ncbi:MAG: hypothetical protein KJ002_14430 [Candidatus Dadabacteria bacterium]|nr:hypothetical protein [Candidatus Dadabacteria bacterium]